MIAFINAISHFLVDAACVSALFSSGADAGLVTGAVMLYNTLAFSTQCVVGLALDSLIGRRRGENAAIRDHSRAQTVIKAQGSLEETLRVHESAQTVTKAQGSLEETIRDHGSAETVIRIHGYLEALAMIVVAAGSLIPCGIILKAVIIGLGNSLFHVTGGVVTLKKSGGKAAPLGVFVAPGAFGVTLGTLCPSTMTWVAVVLVIAAVGCFMSYRRGNGTGAEMRFEGIQEHCNETTEMRSESAQADSGITAGMCSEGAQEHCVAAETVQMANHTDDAEKIAKNGEKPLSPGRYGSVRQSNILLPVVLLTAAVAVRAIGGCAVSFSWKETALDAVLLTLFVFLGKALGGFVCDRFGAREMSAFTITFAAVLTAFFAFSMPLSMAGQFLLNLSMPVTLWLLYRYLPDYPGLAFGLAASALWPGTIIGWLIKLTGPLQSALILICFIFGLGAIMYAEGSLRRY